MIYNKNFLNNYNKYYDIYSKSCSRVFLNTYNNIYSNSSIFLNYMLYMREEFYLTDTIFNDLYFEQIYRLYI